MLRARTSRKSQAANIIGDSKRLALFAHVPRTGGNSISALWRRHLETVKHDLRDPEYCSLPQRQEQFPHLPSFGFVRNPWDRLVSAYCYLGQGGHNQLDADDFVQYCSPWPTFKEFIVNGLGQAAREQIHFLPQSYWVCSGNEVVLDIVCRYERLPSEVERLARLLGLPSQPLPHINSSKHADYGSYFDTEMVRIVEEVYRRDISLFGWTAPEPALTPREPDQPWRGHHRSAVQPYPAFWRFWPRAATDEGTEQCPTKSR